MKAPPSKIPVQHYSGFVPGLFRQPIHRHYSGIDIGTIQPELTVDHYPSTCQQYSYCHICTHAIAGYGRRFPLSQAIACVSPSVLSSQGSLKIQLHLRFSQLSQDNARTCLNHHTIEPMVRIFVAPAPPQRQINDTAPPPSDTAVTTCPLTPEQDEK